MSSESTPTHHLNIGELIVCSKPSIVSTVLGSCVSVCLFSKSKSMGGIIHYAHPRLISRYGQADDFRYGERAITALIAELERATREPAGRLVAKIVGGASEIGGNGISYDIGAENVKIAREILGRCGIPVIGEDVGGAHGRKVLFHTATNRLQVASLYQKQSSGLGRKRKVLIVDDSKTIRDLLKRVLSEDPDFEIIGLAADANEAAAMVRQSKPDVITLDVHMPGLSGVEWLERLLPTNPIPVVMISSLQLQEGNEVFRALELGAVDYVQKPSLSELSVVSSQIREKVKAASFAKVQRPIVSRKAESAVYGELDLRKVIAIGASTGGTEALKVVMASLPAKIPPILIVQHIPPVFSKAFADRLNDLCPFEVKEAEDGDEIKISRVLIAPGGKQMKVQQTAKGLYVRITDDAPVSRHKPSVDYLFHSVASAIGKNAVGVILTGMGSDGAAGLRAMRDKGARTIAQDESTSVVYGMPRVAFEEGAVEKVALLDDIAKEILIAVGSRKAA